MAKDTREAQTINAADVGKLGFQPKLLRKVTRSILKMETNVTVFVKAESALYQGKEVKPKAGQDVEMKAAILLDVVNLTTGEQQQIVCGSVLVSVLNETYPNDSYKGLCFQITKRAGPAGRRYFVFDVDQIEDPTTKK